MCLKVIFIFFYSVSSQFQLYLLLNKQYHPPTAPTRRHSFTASFFLRSQPLGHGVQIYHTNTGQANDLPLHMVPRRPTATHNSSIRRLFQPLTATSDVD